MKNAVKSPMRSNLRKSVLQMIFDGKLKPGERIVESQLSEHLKISRTPLRETLFGLEKEGFVKSELAKGFTLMPLTAREVREIYPMIWTLEGLAIKTARDVTDEQIKILGKANNQFGSAKNPSENLARDRNWHNELISLCPNRRLHETLQCLKDLAHRYEIMYMQDQKRIKTSVHQHEEIMAALARRDSNSVTHLLESHWKQTMDLLLNWLDWSN